MSNLFELESSNSDKDSSRMIKLGYNAVRY